MVFCFQYRNLTELTVLSKNNSTPDQLPSFQQPNLDRENPVVAIVKQLGVKAQCQSTAYHLKIYQ